MLPAAADDCHRVGRPRANREEDELMARRPATIIQADVVRAIRAAKQAGAAEVEVRIGEASIVIRVGASTKEPPLESEGDIVL
jgi:hypothetical protein